MVLKANIKWPTKSVLKSSRKKGLFMLFLCLGFVAIAVFLRDEFDTIWMPIFCGGFFGLCALTFVIQLLKPGRLTLSHEGFEETMLGQTRFFAWRDVSDFSIMNLRSGLFKAATFVSFSRLNEPTGGVFKQAIVKIPGGSEILRDNFGMRSKNLMEIMNAYRKDALRNKSKLKRNV